MRGKKNYLIACSLALLAACSSPQAVVIVNFGENYPEFDEVEKVIENSGMTCALDEHSKSTLSCKSNSGAQGIQSVVAQREGAEFVVRSAYQGNGPNFPNDVQKQYLRVVEGLVALGAQTVELIDFGESVVSRSVSGSDFTKNFFEKMK